MWFTYVLRSEVDSGFYVGITSRLEFRIKEHNSGANRSTKSRAPFELAYLERFESRAAARQREKYLKGGSGREYLKRVAAEKLKRETGK